MPTWQQKQGGFPLSMLRCEVVLDQRTFVCSLRRQAVPLPCFEFKRHVLWSPSFSLRVARAGLCGPNIYSRQPRHINFHHRHRPLARSTFLMQRVSSEAMGTVCAAKRPFCLLYLHPPSPSPLLTFSFSHILALVWQGPLDLVVDVVILTIPPLISLCLW